MSNTDKVKVSKDVAEAIDRVVKSYQRLFPENINETIIKGHIESPDGWRGEGSEHINKLPLDTLIRALYIGYEVEQSPEDRVREYYETVVRMHYTSPRDAIRETLNLLNKQIEGVNA